jgi:diaminopimelate epimerase
MIPVVYVRDVDTTYFEGSCGSGTTACAAAFGTIMGDGTHNFSFPQPAGTIDSTIEIYKGKIQTVTIEGIVTYKELEVEIDL